MIIGVCGKIASGKTEVMKILKKRGFYCIYADKIVHDLYKKNGIGEEKIAAYFGKEFLKRNGSVDRIKLRNLVFTDSYKRKMLENLIYPDVFAEIKLILRKIRRKNIAIEAIYFDQNFLRDFVDKIIWVERPIAGIKNTLAADRGFPVEMAQSVIDIVSKPENIDILIKNNTTLIGLFKKLSRITF